MTAEDIIRELKMFPLEMEGGHCCECYQSKISASDGTHCCGSVIYYLLKGAECSRWHKLTGDERWFYHAGTPAVLNWIDAAGALHTEVLGPDLSRGERPQVLIPGGCFQTAVLANRGETEWGLFGTAVFPGFEYADFTAATEEEIRRFPVKPRTDAGKTEKTRGYFKGED